MEALQALRRSSYEQDKDLLCTVMSVLTDCLLHLAETISPPNPRWWNLVRENLAAALGNSKQGIVGRRSWPATAPEMSAQNGQMSEGVRPISTTRNAAIRLMKTSNSGVRFVSSQQLTTAISASNSIWYLVILRVCL